jgi:hypothetical protein
MNEATKTLIYLGVAAVVLIAAIADRAASRSGANDTSVSSEIDKPMFAEFQDPLTAKSLEIVTFDEGQAALKSFKVAQVGNRWVIPSHGNYPADAENQLRDAATGLITLKVIDVATDVPTEHAELGVVEPSTDKLKVGSEGVGTLVAMQDAKGKDLLRLIVGKPVAGAPDQRFVRKPNQDRVYVAKVDLGKLPTDFDKWIEKDLLKLNALDVSELTIKDYSIVPSPGGRYHYFPRMEATVGWNSEGGNWDLVKLLVRAGQSLREAHLGEHEELNKQKLDEMKTALDDLKIVDVIRKPEGMGASLSGGEDLLKFESALSEFGFLLVPKAGDKFDIAASNGEVLVDMKDGVEYVLRFGKIQGGASDSEEGKLNRYLFVTAQLAQSSLQPPDLIPETADAADPAAPAATNPREGGGGADQEAGDSKEPAANGDAPQAETKADDAKSDAATAKPSDEDDEAGRIKRENQRKLDEYNQKRKKAEQRVAELNARFADWYYVISEDVYKKIHLSRADIVKETIGAKEEGYGVDAFRKLEGEGIKPPKPSTAPPGIGGPGGGPGGAGSPFGGINN